MSSNLHMAAQIIQEESKVPSYELPDLLTTQNGERITTADQWMDKRRPHLIDLFAKEVYGEIPGTIEISSAEIVEQDPNALNNSAHRQQIRLTFAKDSQQLEAHVLMYLPAGVSNPPLFLGYNFYGNHSVTDDPEVLITSSWMRNNESLGITKNRADEASRGGRAHRWAIQQILDAGFALVTVYYGDIDPDRNDFQDGIHPFLYKPQQQHPQDYEWGAIAAWAWGLSRVKDYLEQHPLTADSKVVVMGHSRLGKTALWAGALDTRFDAVISNNSGCGGAALSRRRFGETVKAINTNFPHWFCDNFKKYNENEPQLPIDQHMLVALMAPRPVYIASAQEDLWADPHGEFLSGVHASKVYHLFGKAGLLNATWPAANEPIHNTVGYHIRKGVHDVTDYDWQQFIAWAKKMDIK